MSKNVKIAFFVLLVITIASLATALNLNSKLEKVTTSNQQVVDEEELKQILTAVGAIMVLPEGETPTIATVSDPSKLREQPFFANTKEGDKVLIYSQALKAILWRPSSGKIVEVSALNIAAPQDDVSRSQSETTESEE